jgi:hypothetical protein
MILNYAKQRIAMLIGGSISVSPSYFMIGSGSGAVLATQTSLFNSIDRQLSTSINKDTAYKTKWTGDWNSLEMSGIQLREFGITISGTGTTGSMWSRIGFPAINFDGTNELRIEETWEVY